MADEPALIFEVGPAFFAARGFIFEVGPAFFAARGFIFEVGSAFFAARGFIFEVGPAFFAARGFIFEVGPAFFAVPGFILEVGPAFFAVPGFILEVGPVRAFPRKIFARARFVPDARAIDGRIPGDKTRRSCIMYRDFHYDVVSILSQAAGFSLEEAGLIAHASQYADDCTFYEPMKEMVLNESEVADIERRCTAWEQELKQVFPYATFRHFRAHALVVRDREINENVFDPVCTAYANLQRRLKSLMKKPVALWKELQRLTRDSALLKVYVSFHFVPDYDASRPRKKFFVERGCRFLRDYLGALLDLLGRHPDAADPVRRQGLIALGIALHAFADTWSHEGFSGRWNTAENDIEDLHVARQYVDQEMGAMPDIGHMEAGDWVDRPEAELDFRFCRKLEGRSERVKRQNPVHFLEAAEAIFGLLSRGRPFPPELERFLFHAFCMDLEPAGRSLWFRQRIHEAGDLRSSWPDLRLPPYEREAWIRDIIPVPADYGTRIQYRYAPDADWFFFQVAALAQRNMVHGHIG